MHALLMVQILYSSLAFMDRLDRKYIVQDTAKAWLKPEQAQFKKVNESLFYATIVQKSDFFLVFIHLLLQNMTVIFATSMVNLSFFSLLQKHAAYP
jgi:chlorite dismutase